MPSLRCSYQCSIDKRQTALFIRESGNYFSPSSAHAKQCLNKIRGTNAFMMTFWEFQIDKIFLKVFLKALHSRWISILKSANKRYLSFKPCFIVWRMELLDL